MKKLLVSIMVIGMLFAMTGNVFATTTEEHYGVGPDLVIAYENVHWTIRSMTDPITFTKIWDYEKC